VTALTGSAIGRAATVSHRGMSARRGTRQGGRGGASWQRSQPEERAYGRSGLPGKLLPRAVPPNGTVARLRGAGRRHVDWRLRALAGAGLTAVLEPRRAMCNRWLVAADPADRLPRRRAPMMQWVWFDEGDRSVPVRDAYLQIVHRRPTPRLKRRRGDHGRQRLHRLANGALIGKGSEWTRLYRSRCANISRTARTSRHRGHKQAVGGADCSLRHGPKARPTSQSSPTHLEGFDDGNRRLAQGSIRRRGMEGGQGDWSRGKTGPWGSGGGALRLRTASKSSRASRSNGRSNHRRRPDARW
jgi:hypothetical protein